MHYNIAIIFFLCTGQFRQHTHFNISCMVL